MKKSYEKAEIEIFMFKKEDAIVASGVVLPVDHDNAYVDYSNLFNDFFARWLI